MFQQILDVTILRRRRAGSVILMVALAMVVLMGFAAISVDYGMLVNDRNHLQRACDAAAMAAAQVLKKTGDDTADEASATTIAVDTAAQNGVVVNSSDVTFSNNSAAVTVPARLVRSLLFSRVIGIAKGNVAASATAGVTPASAGYTPYVSPIGITQSSYDAYKDTTTAHDFSFTRHNKDAFGLDDFVLYDLRPQNSKSGSFMQDQLTGNDTEKINVYDPNVGCTSTSCETSLDSNFNSEGKKFKDAISTLISRAAGAPWYDDGNSGWYAKMQSGTADYSNPRVINIIVTNDYPTFDNGTTNMPILSFVPAYISSYDNSTGLFTVQFLPPGTSSNGGFIPGDNGDAINGVRIIQLLG
jgi:Flp pilus assembly protein TadG